MWTLDKPTASLSAAIWAVDGMAILLQSFKKHLPDRSEGVSQLVEDATD